MKSAVLSLAVLLVAPAVQAAPPASNPGAPFQLLVEQNQQIQQRVDAVDGKVDEILVFGLPETTELVDYKVSLPRMEVRVDTRACTSRPEQCLPPPPAQPEPGWDAPAMEGNDRPIALFVLVAINGDGVEGLTADAFAFDNALAPAGGSKTVPCEARCGESWFRGEHNGLYQIFLAPLEDRNWKAGTYAATLKVTVQVPSQYDFIPTERRGTALVTFDIPPAVNVDR